MSQIFDRLGNLIRSVISDIGRTDDDIDLDYDEDLRRAWEELDDFLKEDDFEFEQSSRSYTSHSPGSIPDELRNDYALLGVEFGAKFTDVRTAYKKLIMKYHPDRNNNDPAKLKEATEKTKKINLSYQRIKKWENSGKS